jgi:hypothetical protein
MWKFRAGMIGLLTLLAACGASRSPAAEPAPQSDRVSIPVQIDNQNFSDMNIYLISTGQRWLLGQSSGLSKATLTIPAGVVTATNRVRLLADPIGGSGRITTPLLIVPPGQRVYWTIGSDPATSTASAG